MTTLRPGDKAPDFEGINEKNETITLTQFRNKKLVLYFYPKDNTPGCTMESCNLRDNYRELQKQGFEVVGVSPDSVKKHQNFIKKFDLPFSLLADTDQKICKQFGVWGPKKLFGVNYTGVIRTTFLINGQGIIEEVIQDVNTASHAQQILK